MKSSSADNYYRQFVSSRDFKRERSYTLLQWITMCINPKRTNIPYTYTYIRKAIMWKTKGNMKHYCSSLVIDTITWLVFTHLNFNPKTRARRTCIIYSSRLCLTVSRWRNHLQLYLFVYYIGIYRYIQVLMVYPCNVINS
jgi:hypothetical protein